MTCDKKTLDIKLTDTTAIAVACQNSVPEKVLHKSYSSQGGAFCRALRWRNRLLVKNDEGRPFKRSKNPLTLEDQPAPIVTKLLPYLSVCPTCMHQSGNPRD